MTAQVAASRVEPAPQLVGLATEVAELGSLLEDVLDLAQRGGARRLAEREIGARHLSSACTDTTAARRSAVAAAGPPASCSSRACATSPCWLVTRAAQA